MRVKPTVSIQANGLAQHLQLVKYPSQEDSGRPPQARTPTGNPVVLPNFTTGHSSMLKRIEVDTSGRCVGFAARWKYRAFRELISAQWATIGLSVIPPAHSRIHRYIPPTETTNEPSSYSLYRPHLRARHHRTRPSRASTLPGALQHAFDWYSSPRARLDFGNAALLVPARP